MPTKLDDHLVQTSLAALTDWQGDTERIRRTAQLSDQQAEQVLTNVTTTADAMNHHPDVRRDGGRVTFELSTHSEGGVTELDIALASRIDDFIAHATGASRAPAGQVGGTTVSAQSETPAGAGAQTRPHDTFEPAVGVPSAPGGSPGAGGGATLPDPEPGAPEPGLATPERQGGPPEEDATSPS